MPVLAGPAGQLRTRGCRVPVPANAAMRLKEKVRVWRRALSGVPPRIEGEACLTPARNSFSRDPTHPVIACAAPRVLVTPEHRGSHNPPRAPPGLLVLRRAYHEFLCLGGLRGGDSRGGLEASGAPGADPGLRCNRLRFRRLPAVRGRKAAGVVEAKKAGATLIEMFAGPVGPLRSGLAGGGASRLAPAVALCLRVHRRGNSPPLRRRWPRSPGRIRFRRPETLLPGSIRLPERFPLVIPASPVAAEAAPTESPAPRGRSPPGSSPHPPSSSPTTTR